jgi:hypothetical protein
LANQKRLRSFDVGSLLTLWALYYFKADLLTFFEGLETVYIDSGIVRIQVFATIIRRDKTQTLFGM